MVDPSILRREDMKCPVLAALVVAISQSYEYEKEVSNILVVGLLSVKLIFHKSFSLCYTNA